MEGLLGLFLSAAQEHPAVQFRTMEIDRGTDLSLALRAALDKGFAEVELIHREGRIFTSQAHPAPAVFGDPPPPTLNPGDVVVISGGGTGISAHLARALVPFAPRLVFLGRTRLDPSGHSPDLPSPRDRPDPGGSARLGNRGHVPGLRCHRPRGGSCRPGRCGRPLWPDRRHHPRRRRPPGRFPRSDDPRGFLPRHGREVPGSLESILGGRGGGVEVLRGPFLGGGHPGKSRPDQLRCRQPHDVGAAPIPPPQERRHPLQGVDAATDRGSGHGRGPGGPGLSQTQGRGLRPCPGACRPVLPGTLRRPGRRRLGHVHQDPARGEDGAARGYQPSRAPWTAGWRPLGLQPFGFPHDRWPLLPGPPAGTGGGLTGRSPGRTTFGSRITGRSRPSLIHWSPPS